MKKVLFALGLVASLSSAALASGPHGSRHHAASKVDPVAVSFERAGLMGTDRNKSSDRYFVEVAASFDRAGLTSPVAARTVAGSGSDTHYIDLVDASFERSGLTSRQVVAAKSIQLTLRCN